MSTRSQSLQSVATFPPQKCIRGKKMRVRVRERIKKAKTNEYHIQLRYFFNLQDPNNPSGVEFMFELNISTPDE
jgi:hypothetical protein